MKIRGSVVSLRFIFPHPPEEEKKKLFSQLSRALPRSSPQRPCLALHLHLPCPCLAAAVRFSLCFQYRSSYDRVMCQSSVLPLAHDRLPPNRLLEDSRVEKTLREY